MPVRSTPAPASALDPRMRVLIANRGEIAVRIARTCARLGLPTVALFTDLDVDAPHVRACDEAAHVPSYLDIEAVVARARAYGCWFVHPGYGFLSERPEFAAALEEVDLGLVGPSSRVMEQMGRKDAARAIAVAAGVPVVPTGEDAAYPVLVKAAAGGGGKGMRIVRSETEMAEAVAAAKREALHAFGDDTMLIEKYVERGRHIEVQVIGDTHGTVLHLGERDCSTQRRHQKVLEEAPAPTLDDATRARIRAAGVELAAHVGYVGAGTVEFLLDEATGEFYFLEMNTRLQVEHPVTEAITGLDLVELQLRVAAGEPLGLTQDDITFTGHAIEARVYAEDAYGGFLPQAGTATTVVWPGGIDGVRVDHALESGQVVSTSYDPMLGKVIAHGAGREQARARLVAALEATSVLGLTTNVGFLRELAASSAFAGCEIDTAWLDRHEVPAPDPSEARGVAARLWLDANASSTGPFAADGWRAGGPALTPTVPFVEGDAVAAPRAPEGVVARVTRHGVELAHRGQRHVLTLPGPSGDAGAAAGDGTVLAPMPGTVLEVRVTPGQQVAEGDVLGVVEAMKMELALRAPHAGTVGTVDAAAGDQVVLGAVLFTVDAAP
ncbi:biotin carboxylase N-terminal domain-containing protein [Nocardioides sp.]|uniref:ATP-binding protein n=1 Tax=Nocardioides sp. TaxID=35761 RepID=UPI00351786A9